MEDASAEFENFHQVEFVNASGKNNTFAELFG